MDLKSFHEQYKMYKIKTKQSKKNKNKIKTFQPFSLIILNNIFYINHITQAMFSWSCPIWSVPHLSFILCAKYKTFCY